MIPNVHQSIDDIIKAARPEQRVIWQQIRLLTGENASVRQLYFEGAVTGTEFTVFSANKLYICLQLDVAAITAPVASAHYVVVYNEANANIFTIANASYYWNGTTAAPNNFPNQCRLDNFYFGRIVATGYTQIKFIGYRLTY